MFVGSLGLDLGAAKNGSSIPGPVWIPVSVAQPVQVYRYRGSAGMRTLSVRSIPWLFGAAAAHFEFPKKSIGESRRFNLTEEI